MTSREWSGRPPGGTESNYARENVKSFPKIPNGANVKSFPIQKANLNHSMADTNDYLKAMTMNKVSAEQHSYKTNPIC